MPGRAMLGAWLRSEARPSQRVRVAHPDFQRRVLSVEIGTFRAWLCYDGARQAVLWSCAILADDAGRLRRVRFSDCFTALKVVIDGEEAAVVSERIPAVGYLFIALGILFFLWRGGAGGMAMAFYASMLVRNVFISRHALWRKSLYSFFILTALNAALLLSYRLMSAWLR